MLLELLYHDGANEKAMRILRLWLFFGYCTTLIFMWGQQGGMELSELVMTAFLLPWLMFFPIVLCSPLSLMVPFLMALLLFKQYGGEGGTLALLLAVTCTILLNIVLGKVYRWTR
jgi:hypothetical protein